MTRIPAQTRTYSEPTMVGDLLITSGADTYPIPNRASDGRWNPLTEGAGWRLLSQPNSVGWKGFPCHRFQVGDDQAWLLGDLYDSSETQVEPLVSDVISGRRSAGELNGHFLLIARDATNACWDFWTSRFGTVHAYYADDGERTALGTCFRDVAAVASRRELDWEALTFFFGTGFFPADRTHYRDVRILRPSRHYTFNVEGRLQESERYWSWTHAPDQDRSYAQTVDDFAELIHTVVREQARDGRVALPISGGLDSRTTVAALDARTRAASELWAYSYGYTPESVETRIARRIGRARALPVETFTIEEYLFDRIEDALDATEGFQDLTQHRQTAIAPALNAHADAVIAAHWGDVWLDAMGAEPGIGERGLADLASRKVLKRGRKWLLDRLCLPQVEEAPEALIRAQVKDGFGAVAHLEDPDFRLKAYKTEQWSFRWTLASLRAYQAAALPRLPFYDTRMTDFFATVPTEYLAGRRLQIDYLKRHAPDLARITWQAEHANLYLYEHLRPLRLPRAAVRKAVRMLRGKKAIQRNWEVQFLSSRGRDGLRRWILEPGLALHEFVPIEELETLLAELQATPNAANGYTVSMLLTFSAWLEVHHRG